MNPVRKQRLILILLLVAGVGLAVTLMLFALKENINHYYSPLEMEQGLAPYNKKIRGGGLVVPGSVNRDPNSLEVTFKITDGAGTISVSYNGILPDLFVEGSGVVATGVLTPDGHFKASELLARHDADYMPPVVQKAIDKAHSTQKEEQKKEEKSAGEGK